MTDDRSLVTEEVVEKACQHQYGLDYPHSFAKVVDDLRRDGMRRTLEAVAGDIAEAVRREWEHERNVLRFEMRSAADWLEQGGDSAMAAVALRRALNEQTFHLARCQDCTPALPVPFSDKAECLGWIKTHEATGHRVKYNVEIREASP